MPLGFPYTASGNLLALFIFFGWGGHRSR